jgi:outer membrane receptor protein involved in Fe transport
MRLRRSCWAFPSSTGISEVGTTRAFLHSYGFYGVDTWQVTNKLTLNLGLRWEQPGSYSEVNNNGHGAAAEPGDDAAELSPIP